MKKPALGSSEAGCSSSPHPPQPQWTGPGGQQDNPCQERYAKTTWLLSMVTMSKMIRYLPGFGITFTFVTSVIFNFDQVDLTWCGRMHWIPTLSGVIGVVPQRYVMQICVALHSAPRFVVGWAYDQYFMCRIRHIATKDRSLFRRLVRLRFWLNSGEVFSLCLVTCIPVKENYEFHEKSFAIYIIFAVFNMLFATLLFKWAHPEPRQRRVEFSYSVKKTVFFAHLSFVICMIYFHRRYMMYCQPYAFDLFSSCEYGIAFAQIFYNEAVLYDIGGADLRLAKLVISKVTGDQHQKTSD